MSVLFFEIKKKINESQFVDYEITAIVVISGRGKARHGGRATADGGRETENAKRT